MAKSIISDLLQIFRSSVSAVLPEKLIRNTVKYNPNNEELIISDQTYNLPNRNVYLIGTGKAVQNMTIEVEKILGSKIKQGIVSVPVGSLSNKNIARNERVIYYEGAKNNLPDKDAQDSASKVKNLLTKLENDDFLLVLISGGGSALLPLPKGPISLEEKTQLVKKLANAGADITELNTVRKKLSELKGGQLALLAQPAEVVSLILSDIVGDPLDLIASGPTTENKDHPNAAINIVKKYNLYDQLPSSIKVVLESNNNQEKSTKIKVENYVIGSNKLSIKAAVNESKSLNYLPIAVSNLVTGNVKDIAQEYVKLSKLFCDCMRGSIDKKTLQDSLVSLDIPGIQTDCLDGIDIQEVTKLQSNICLILGGEITVEVKGTGKGGRNQQLALEFSNFINASKNNFKSFEVYLLSAGTDGIDGPTNAAGAIGYIDLISDAKKENIDRHKYLNNYDSYNFYKDFNNGQLHVITGHTNTNVMDIHILLLRRKLN